RRARAWPSWPPRRSTSTTRPTRPWKAVTPSLKAAGRLQEVPAIVPRGGSLERGLEAERRHERVAARRVGVGIHDVLKALLRGQPAGELREIGQLERHLRGLCTPALLALALDVLRAGVGGRHAQTDFVVLAAADRAGEDGTAARVGREPVHTWVADAELREERQSPRGILGVRGHDTLGDEIRPATASVPDWIAVTIGVAQVVEHARVVPAAYCDLAVLGNVGRRATG